MNQTQMKRFKERIEEKAIKARKRLHNAPNDRQLAFLEEKNGNSRNRQIDGLIQRHVNFYRDGKNRRASAWLTPAEDRNFEKVGQVHELADQKIRRIEDEAIDAVIFLNESDAIKALAKFEKDVAKIK